MCALYGRLTGQGMLTACETDILGALSMLVSYSASLGEMVPHFIDWTIQHRDDPNCFLAWHCGNAPMCLGGPSCRPRVRVQSILGKIFGNGDTVIRGGYSRLYGRLNGVKLIMSLVNNTGIGQPINCLGASRDGQCLGTNGTDPITTFRNLPPSSFRSESRLRFPSAVLDPGRWNITRGRSGRYDPLLTGMARWPRRLSL